MEILVTHLVTLRQIFWLTHLILAPLTHNHALLDLNLFMVINNMVIILHPHLLIWRLDDLIDLLGQVHAVILGFLVSAHDGLLLVRLLLL